MTGLLTDPLALLYWVAIAAAVVWWAWSMRKAARPRRRSPREDAELACVLAAIERLQPAPAAPRDC
jgi:hypothetical protein